MIIDYDGQSYSFAMDDVTVKQAIKIEKYMGCSFAEWGKTLEGGSPGLQSLQALGWLILEQGAADVPIEDTDFKIGRLGEALMKAAAAETPAPAEDEPVPTVAAESNGHGAAAALSPVSLPPSSDMISR